MQTLLGVDLGLRTGLALYGDDGRLRWYRSHHYQNVTKLKRGCFGVLREIDGLCAIVVEGDRALADIWAKAAERVGATLTMVTPEAWREAVLLPRERRSGDDAKRFADARAREVIARSGIRRPGALRHDTAEAILIGLWGVLECGWLEPTDSSPHR